MARNSTLRLKVLESYNNDIGTGVARIDQNSMASIGVSVGDVIEISAKKTTAAKCLPLYPSDEGKRIIRLDGFSRRNANVVINDAVIIQKIRAVPAERVSVVPFGVIPPIDERYLADALESVPLTKGDSVMVPYFGGRLEFLVADIIPPREPVVVSQKTIFKITGGVAVTKESVRDISLRIEYGVRSAADKTFLRMKFILSHIKSEEVGEFEKELKQELLQKMFEKYKNAAEEILANTKEQLIKKLKEQSDVEVKLTDIMYAILDRCRSIND